jgi:phosphate starvation-inducible PhoH-like protein
LAFSSKGTRTLLEKPKGRRPSRYKNAEEEAGGKVFGLTPLNDNQSLYIDALRSHNQIIVLGYSGTGKTFIAASEAANLYLAKRINRIIVTRPNVSVGKDLGYFPGDINEKFGPWAAPVVDVLQQRLGKGVVETGIKNGNIELAPMSVMRGRSFKDAFVILDEAQNTTVPEIKMFLTRIGEDCKVVINGDIKQSDIKDQSGLSKIIHLVKKFDMDIPIIEFGIDDIVRSDACKQWIISFESERL